MSSKYPPEISDAIDALWMKAKELLQPGCPELYPRALNIYTLMRDLMLDWQKKHEERIHKGVPYHMRGLTLLVMGQKESLWEFLYAFTEDVITESLGVKPIAEERMAHLMLTKYWSVPEKELAKLKEQLQSFTKVPLQPEVALKEALKSISLDIESIAKFPSPEKRSIKKYGGLDDLPGTYSKRVFLGGNYDNMVLIREVERIIRDCDFEPIIAIDFSVRPDQFYTFDRLLLEQCQQAVFEVTIGDGHLIEIEHALSLPNRRCIAIYQIRDIWGRHVPPPAITSMLTTATNLKIIPYENFDELKTKLCNALKPT